MTETAAKTSYKTGLPPGSLVHVGEVLEQKTRISLIDYSQENLDEKEIEDLDEMLTFIKRDTVTWVIVEGLSQVEIIAHIGNLFGIHPLVQEDILHTNQRPKFEEYEDYLFLVLKSCRPMAQEKFSISYEQISLLVMKNVVFTFKEKVDDVLHPVMQRIRTSKGRFRSLGADYLTYAILDNIVDQNFVVIDSLDEAIMHIEDDLLTLPTQATLHEIQQLKRELINLRRYVSPVRELMAGLLRSETPLISESTQLYLRDVTDHGIRVIESIESYREMLTGLLDIYISNVSNKMNEVMKVLTVFASIFIPLTFLAGIYGMNFEYMPELKWKWAYPVLWLAFITIPVVLLFYFKRKKWL